MKKILSFLFFFLCAMVMCISYAAAYIDPSAVTYIVQAVAAIVIAAGAALGFYWRRIKRALKKKKDVDEDEEYDDEDEDEDEE